MSREELAKEIEKYNWYHRIEVAEGLVTPGNKMDYHPDIWAMIEKSMNELDYQGKKVLDVGCRDGYFSFRAERLGAEVVAIDNDLSKGMKDLLIPHFKSSVQLQEANLYDITPDTFGQFHIIQFLGVLYHLRYPFWGLKKMVDCLLPGGTLMIESGMMVNPALKDHDLLFCPVDHVYDATSCTFFNQKALTTTLESMGMELTYADSLEQGGSIKQQVKRTIKSNDPFRGRQLFLFRKRTSNDPEMKDISKYWDEKHDMHTTFTTS